MSLDQQLQDEQDMRAQFPPGERKASGQTKKGSFTEAVTNCIVGFPLNFVLNIVILPHTWDNEHKAQSAFITGVVFTGVSIFRQLVIRRWFNSIKAKWNHKEA